MSEDNFQFPHFLGPMMGAPFLIGLFVMEWSRYERRFIGLIAYLEGLQFQEAMNALLDEPAGNWLPRLGVARSKLTEPSPATPYLDAIELLHAEMLNVRHAVVHGFWAGFDEEYKSVRGFKPRGKDHMVAVLSLSEMQTWSNKVALLKMHVINAERTLRGDPPV